MPSYRCAICSNQTDNQEYSISEMMMGTRERFIYFQCSRCGCLQISRIPENLHEYYPATYYSFETDPPYSAWKKFRYKHRLAFFLHEKDWLGWVFSLCTSAAVPDYFEWIKRARVNFSSSILDVGCGGGNFLFKLAQVGFNNLNGIDPFIKESKKHDNGVTLKKAYLHEIQEQFDFITLHHSLEHMPDQQAVFKDLKRLLKPGGYLLVRVPVVSSFAWRHYRENWVQIDAPRHLFIPSVESIRLLAEAADLTLESCVFDSNEFQFWGSEQYVAGIPLLDERAYQQNEESLEKSLFSKQSMQKFREKALELNHQDDGDQACFYFLNK